MAHIVDIRSWLRNRLSYRPHTLVIVLVLLVLVLPPHPVSGQTPDAGQVDKIIAVLKDVGFPEPAPSMHPNLDGMRGVWAGRGNSEPGGPGGVEDAVLVGVFSKEEDARNAFQRLREEKSTGRLIAGHLGLQSIMFESLTVGGDVTAAVSVDHWRLKFCTERKWDPACELGIAGGIFLCGNLLVEIVEQKRGAVPSPREQLYTDARNGVTGLTQQIASGLQAQGACAASPPVDLKIHHVEVVQVIQDEKNCVPLVADKSTVARVFVQLEGKPTQAVGKVITGTLKSSRSAELLMLKEVPIELSAKPDREKLDHSLNFVLPKDWTTEGELSLEATIQPPDGLHDTDAANNAKALRKQTVKVTFVKRNSLTIAYLPLCFQPPGRKEAVCPKEELLAQFDDWVARLYPVADNGVTYIPLAAATLTWHKPLKTDADGDKLLTFLRKFDSMIERAIPGLFDFLTAWLPPDEEIKVAQGLGEMIGVTPGATGRVSWLVDVSLVAQAESSKLLAHEVGHNLGLLHPDTAFDACKTKRHPQRNSGWPYAMGVIQEVGLGIQKDVQKMEVIPKSRYDLMCYAPASNSWVSVYHYKRLFERNLRPRAAETDQISNRELANRCFNPPAKTSDYRPQGGRPPGLASLHVGDSSSLLEAPPVQARAEYLVVSGSAARDGSAGQLEPTYRVTSVLPGAPSDPAGNHCLRFGGAGGTLGDYCFTLRFETPEAHEPLDEETFVLKVPYVEGTQRLALVRSDKELAVLDASPNAPELSITSPRSGETWQGEQTIRWEATDADGGAMMYVVSYTPDGGDTWYPLDIDSQESQFTFDTAGIASGDQIFFRVLASDGLNTAKAEVGPIKVPEQSAAATPALPTEVATPVPPTEQPTELVTSAPPTAQPAEAITSAPPTEQIVAAVPAPATAQPAAAAPVSVTTQPVLALALGGGGCLVLVALLAGTLLILRARPRRAPSVAPGRPPQPAPARLVVVRGSANVAFADLYGVVTIGRDPSSTLVLDDREASRQHARVDFVNGAWVVGDLNSSNGTLVNGVRITHHALRPGDQIQIGQTVLTIEFLDQL